jgi:hypothetical protein
MKRFLFAVPVLAALVGFGGTAYAVTAHAAQPAAKAGQPLYSEQMVLFNCPGGRAEVKPSSYLTYCGDGGETYAKMKWTSWTPQMASATSTLGVNSCTPNCAAGHTSNYPALNVLWGSTTVKGHPGELAYTHMTVIFPGKKPSGFAQTFTIKLYVP